MTTTEILMIMGIAVPVLTVLIGGIFGVLYAVKRGKELTDEQQRKDREHDQKLQEMAIVLEGVKVAQNGILGEVTARLDALNNELRSVRRWMERHEDSK